MKLSHSQIDGALCHAIGTLKDKSLNPPLRVRGQGMVTFAFEKNAAVRE
jgi:hypothetical protein